MEADNALQPVWDWCLRNLGVTGIASPTFLLTAVVAGIYLPGILFSFVDVVVTRRQTLAQCWAVYWRAMKWYGSLRSRRPCFEFAIELRASRSSWK